MYVGEQIHAQVRERGLLHKHVTLGNVLVDMFAKCGNLGKAKEVFDGLLQRDAISWNSLIIGHVQHGLSDQALK